MTTWWMVDAMFLKLSSIPTGTFQPDAQLTIRTPRQRQRCRLPGREGTFGILPPPPHTHIALRSAVAQPLLFANENVKKMAMNVHPDSSPQGRQKRTPPDGQVLPEGDPPQGYICLGGF